nr:hypothetical protein [Tanacetum cinerariifolium]
ECGITPSRVILFGDIPIVILSTSVIAPETSTIALVISSATPVVETTLVASPTGLCGLVPYSDFDSDSPDEMDSPESKVTTRSSSPFDFPIAPVTAPHETRRRVAILIRPGEAIPLGRPYRTRPNGPRRVMTARKRVGPLPARRLAWRRVSPRSLDHRPSFSSSPTDSSPVHSSGLDTPDQTHSGSSTRVVSPRLGYPPSSSGDSSERPLHSSSHSVGPSRKRCRSPADSLSSSTPVTRSLAPARANLLPPRKRFRDSYSFETSMEEDTEIDTIETEDGRELDIVDRDDARDRVEIDPRDIRDDTKEYEADTSAGDTVEVDGIVRSFEDMPIDLDDVVRDFYHHMSEADQLIASEERARMTEKIESLRLENLKEEFCQIHEDRDENKLMEQMTSMCEMVGQLIQKKQEEKQIQVDQADNARYWKIPAYYDDDDDYNFPITPNEPVDSHIMGDEHLDTVSATESDELIKSSVENLVPNQSESEGENGCDLPACFTT